ncbi:unnamed protein product [Vicia faba]|uniref:Major facilitator superfamily (MFS) profile domain-containing protein n=1 Tax=Vicia faba TaxID=3906 RepID=A0AAV1A026_VICFA|nr:unnamed protein product [Vicia faba]
MTMGDDEYTVDDALVSLGFGKFQILVLVYAGIGWISEAMEMMLLSFVGPAVRSAWNLSSHEESFITSVVFAGMLIGAYSWGIVSDQHGRRKGFLITAILTSTSGFLSAFSPNYFSLLLFRSLVGLGLGGGPVLSSWFLEFVPPTNRGTWMVIFSAFWTLGTIFEASLAWIVMPTLGWRWLLALSSLPTSFLLLFYKITPESPRYLCLKGRTAEAVHVLETIATLNGTKLPSGQPFYYGQCFSTDKSQDISYKGVFIASFAELPGLLLSAVAVDKLGRKLSMSIMFFMCCIFLLPLTFYLPQDLTTGLLFGARICITVTFTVVYIYAPEIYPTSVRTTGVGVASSVGRIGGMLCPLVAVGLVHGCHQTIAVLLFEIVALVSGICVMFFPFETMGQELQDTVSSVKHTDNAQT